MIKQMWAASTLMDKVLFILGSLGGVQNLFLQEYLVAMLFFVIALDQVSIATLRNHVGLHWAEKK